MIYYTSLSSEFRFRQRQRRPQRMPRYWRIVSNFHTIGEVIKVVQAPNWVGGLRKGAFAIKADPKLKGRKISVASFTLQETTEDVARSFGTVSNSAPAETVTGPATQAVETNEAVPVAPEPEPER